MLADELVSAPVPLGRPVRPAEPFCPASPVGPVGPVGPVPNRDNVLADVLVSAPAPLGPVRPFGPFRPVGPVGSVGPRWIAGTTKLHSRMPVTTTTAQKATTIVRDRILRVIPAFVAVLAIYGRVC